VRRVAAVLLLGLPLAGAGSPGSQETGTAREESRLSGRAVPEIDLQLADGQVTRLSALSSDKPLLLSFFYRRCTGICRPFLRQVRDTLRKIGGLQTDYRVLALSFDDADTAADMRAQAATFGLENESGWIFAVADPEATARLTAALGFWYRFDPETRQYEHDVVLVVIKNGRVMRALLDSPSDPQRLRELAWELRGKVIPYYRVAAGKPLRCLAFDPGSGEVRMDWGMLVLAAPALAAIALAIAVFRASAPRRRRPGGKSDIVERSAEPGRQ